jgi:hypothetical protein
MNQSRYRVASHVVTRRVGDELVLLSMASEQYFGLDAIGTVIFEQLAAGASVEEIVAAVASTFDVPPERVASDATTLLSELTEAELIEPLA